MDATRICVLCLALLVCVPGIVRAGQTVNSAAGVTMTGSMMESVYHDPTAAVTVIDPFGKVNPQEYKDGIAALGKLRAKMRELKRDLTEPEFDLIVGQYTKAKKAFSNLGITFANFDERAIGPMIARINNNKFDLKGNKKMILAIDKSKPPQTSSHMEVQHVEIDCPQKNEWLFLPACDYCANWKTAQSDDWFQLQWKTGGIYVVGAGLYGVGSKGSPTSCCTPQKAGKITYKQKGPCYADVPMTVWDPEVVSVVKYPAQLVLKNGELVWQVTVPGNQISPTTGEDLGENQFISTAPDLPEGTNTIQLPVDPKTGEPTTLSSTPPCVHGPTGGKTEPGTTYKQPPLPKKKK